MERCQRSFRSIAGGVLLCATLMAACNPFAPGLDDSPTGPSSLLGDRTTVEGIFQNIRYAYAFRDTSIYGQLLADDFTFIYRDYEQSRDISWGRDEEMLSTYGLFQNTERLDVVWNNIISLSADSADTRASVSRNFNLTVTFNPSDVVRVDGYVSLTLRRNPNDGTWSIVVWRDESNF